MKGRQHLNGVPDFVTTHADYLRAMNFRLRSENTHARCLLTNLLRLVEADEKADDAPVVIAAAKAYLLD